MFENELIRFMREPRERLVDTINALDDPLRAALMPVYVHCGRLVVAEASDEASVAVAVAVAKSMDVPLPRVQERMAQLAGLFALRSRLDGSMDVRPSDDRRRPDRHRPRAPAIDRRPGAWRRFGSDPRRLRLQGSALPHEDAPVVLRRGLGGARRCSGADPANEPPRSRSDPDCDAGCRAQGVDAVDKVRLCQPARATTAAPGLASSPASLERRVSPAFTPGGRR